MLFTIRQSSDDNACSRAGMSSGLSGTTNGFLPCRPGRSRFLSCWKKSWLRDRVPHRTSLPLSDWRLAVCCTSMPWSVMSLTVTSLVGNGRKMSMLNCLRE
jgi:hypothetical protein